MPKALLVCPEYPPSYWGFQYALDFVGKRAAMPPLGLLTIAALFPPDYELRVVDMNVRPLEDSDLDWADMVMTSTMVVQQASLTEVIRRCNARQLPVVCGGPHPTSFHDEIQAAFPDGGGADHFVLGEVEQTFSTFLEQLRAGTAPHIVPAPDKPDVTNTPPPRYDLIDLYPYGSMAIQFSRGCPFDCEFCDITKLYGRVPRTKAPAQVLAEFDVLHALGWRGAVFLVDDNFIGNKRAAMDLLPEIAKWQREKGFPFSLFTEASVNVAQVPGMLAAMAEANFSMLFLGIESPNEDALKKTAKPQNTSKKDTASSHLMKAVREIQSHGIEVTGGFIIGLDGDTEFDSHVSFIQEAGIPMAMTGLLTAIKGTDLYLRLQREGRLLAQSTGNNTDVALNFVPEMPADKLVAEYRRIVTTLYQPTLENYFERCWTLLQNLKPRPQWGRSVNRREIVALPRSILRQVFSRQGPAYLRFLGRVLAHRPRLLPEAVRLAVMGYHFETITSQTLAVHGLKQELERELAAFRAEVSRRAHLSAERLDPLVQRVQAARARVHARSRRLRREFRAGVHEALASFRTSVDATLEQVRTSLGPQRELAE